MIWRAGTSVRYRWVSTYWEGGVPSLIWAYSVTTGVAPPPSGSVAADEHQRAGYTPAQHHTALSGHIGGGFAYGWSEIARAHQ